MIIEQKLPFHRVFKRLNAVDMKAAEDAIDAIAANPGAGEMKRGDLLGLRVHKFRINRQVVLLAYRYNVQSDTLMLEGLGSHENFYRDLKKGN